MDEQSILSRELVPVLLGLSHTTHRISRRLFREYGVCSHVFCDRNAYAIRIFSISMKIHTVPHTSNERLLVTALEDFAHHSRQTDIILYLVPCTEEAIAFVRQNRALLEREFVIAKKTALAHRPYFSAAPLRDKERSRSHD